MPAAAPCRIALLCLFVAAFVVRGWQAERMAIEHFDEGVYASNLFAGERLDFAYPDRHLYAPPGWPATLEWVLIFAGGNPHSVMWANVLLGALLVPAVWWTTRGLLAESGVERHLAESAALAAAALVGFHDLLIQYSRAALTDVPVTFWITLAVGAGVRGMTRTRIPWLGLSGVCTALAWWTKYNGWLPIAILGAGVAGWGLAGWWRPKDVEKSGDRRESGTAHRAVAPGTKPWQAVLAVAGIALAAFLLWSPVLMSLQKTGGYAVVAQNHAGYVSGLAHWIESARTHLKVDRHYSHVATVVAGLLSFLIACSCFTWNNEQSLPRRYCVGCAIGPLGLIALSPWIGSLPFLIWLAAYGLVVWPRQRPSNDERIRRLPRWIVLAWISGLGVATPLYRPYPRLILPLLTGLCIAAGAGVAFFIARQQSRAGGVRGDQTESRKGIRRDARRHAVTVGGSLIATAIVLVAASYLAPVAWQDRRGLQRGADEIRQIIGQDLLPRAEAAVEGLDSVIYVLAEPALYYHLAAQDDETLQYVTQPSSNFGMLQPGAIDERVPAYLVLNPSAALPAGGLQRLSERAELVGTIPYLPSDLVLLDRYLPSQLSQHREQELQVWRISGEAGR